MTPTEGMNMYWTSLEDLQEVSKYMRINVDILKEEITQHINKELVRFRKELESHISKQSTVTNLKE